jgi:ABC-2 type transport system permease protein
MKYLKQLSIVTFWEYRRFFKPKNEALGLIIMLVVSVIFYIGGRYALSEKNEKPKLSITPNPDSLLVGLLSENFSLNIVPSDEKDVIIEQIAQNKEGMLLEPGEKAFIIYAYKTPKSINELRAKLDAYNMTKSMQAKGISKQDFESLFIPAVLHESYIYTDNSRSRIIMVWFFAGLMIMAVFLSFAYQFTSITGEKQLKITEQIVSAIRPQVWMDGKIFGITLTGLSSMITYALLSILGGILFLQFTKVPVSNILAYIHLPSILLFFVFAFMGILIWNSILAAIASIITDPNNSGKSGLMMLPLLFVIATFLVIRDPDSSLSVFLAWFPLTSATAMPMRWAITEVSWWQLPGSMIVLFITFYILRKLAARIFRISILITGKEPSWAEILKMVKETR